MPTRAQVRPFAAALIGDYAEGTATSGSSTSQLVCAASPFLSSIAQDPLYEDQFLYIPSAIATDQERAVKAYTSVSGLFTPDNPWSVEQDARPFEVHGALSVIAPRNGLHALIDQGLKRCLIEAEFTFSTATATARRHSLAVAAPWLTNPMLVRQVGYLGATEVRADVDPYEREIRGEAKASGGTVYLEGFSANTTDIIYVKVLKPAYNACAAAASPTVFTQNGLLLEADVCIPSIEYAGWAAVVEVQLRFGSKFANTAKTEIRENLAIAATMLRKYVEQEAARVPRTFRTMQHWGPVRH